MGCKQSKAIPLERDPKQEVVNLKKSQKFSNIMSGKPVATQKPNFCEVSSDNQVPSITPTLEDDLILQDVDSGDEVLWELPERSNEAKLPPNVSPSLGAKRHEFSGHCTPTPINNPSRLGMAAFENATLDKEYEQIPVDDESSLCYDSEEEGISLSRRIPGLPGNSQDIFKRYQDDLQEKPQRPLNSHYRMAYVMNQVRVANMTGQSLQLTKKDMEYLERKERRENEQESKRLAKEGMDAFIAANTTRPDPPTMPKSPSQTVCAPVSTHIKRRRVKFTKVKVLKRPGRELPTIAEKVEHELKGLFKTTPKKTKVVPMGYDNLGRAMDQRGPAPRVAWM